MTSQQKSKKLRGIYVYWQIPNFKFRRGYRFTTVPAETHALARFTRKYDWFLSPRRD
jgi:hypothetical protein